MAVIPDILPGLHTGPRFCWRLLVELDPMIYDPGVLEVSKILIPLFCLSGYPSLF